MRKRLFAIPVLLGMMVATLVGISLATPVEDLTTLADYYPEDTAIYMTIRTDAGYIETLDGLLNTVDGNLGGLLGGTSLSDLLDFASFSATGQGFDVSVGSWLGNTASLGITDYGALLKLSASVPDPADVPFVLSAEIINRSVAESMLGYRAGADPIPQEIGDFSVYAADGAVIALSDDTLLIGTSLATITASIETEDSLGESDLFNNTIAALPNGDYNILMYVNSGLIGQQSMKMLQDEMEMLDFDLSPLMNMMGNSSVDSTVAVAFTLLDGRSLVIDMATVLGEDGIAQRETMPGYIEQNPVNPDFAAFIPQHGGQLLVHDNNFGPDLLAVFAALDAIGPALDQGADALVEVAAQQGMSSEVAIAREVVEMIDLGTLNIGGILLNQITPIFAGFTGLNLEHDVLDYLTGDYAIYLSLIPVSSDLSFSLDVAFIYENQDSDGAANILEHLKEAADLYELNYSVSETDGGEVIYYTAPLRVPFLLAGSPIVDFAYETPELDFAVGYNGDIFAVGSRPGVDFALEADGASLADDEDYSYAAENLLLENSVTVWYIGTETLIDALPALNVLIDDMTMIEQAQFFLSQVESLTISGAMPEEGVTNVRLTVTFPANVEPMNIIPDEPTATEESVAAAEPTKSAPVEVAAAVDGTLWSIVNQDSRFSTLAAALASITGAETILDDENAAFTLFAPTDAAFEALMAELNMSAEELLAEEQLLSDVLSYHILIGEYPAGDVVALDGSEVETGLPNTTISIAINNGMVVLNDSANVIEADVIATNGVIHVIDVVLSLPAPPEDSVTAASGFVPIDAVARYEGVRSGLTIDGYPYLGALGNNSAVAVVEFGSFGCPHCKTFHDEAGEALAELIQSGEITFVYVPIINADTAYAEAGAIGSLCAAEQGAFGPYHDTLFAWQGITLSDITLRAIATELSLDMDAFVSCLAESKADTISRGLDLMIASGVGGTPGFLVNGEVVNRADLFDAIESAS